MENPILKLIVNGGLVYNGESHWLIIWENPNFIMEKRHCDYQTIDCQLFFFIHGGSPKCLVEFMENPILEWMMTGGALFLRTLPYGIEMKKHSDIIRDNQNPHVSKCGNYATGWCPSTTVCWLVHPTNKCHLCLAQTTGGPVCSQLGYLGAPTYRGVSKAYVDSLQF